MLRSLKFWTWNIFLLFVNVNINWLLFRTNELDLTAFLAAITALGYVSDRTRISLSHRIGFEVPLEIGIGLAQALDERIIEKYPDIAIAFGTSECDSRLSGVDESGLCSAYAANACYTHFAARDLRAKVPNWAGQACCHANYNLTAGAAHKHVEKCHGGKNSAMVGWLGCFHGSRMLHEQWERCPETGAIIFRCAQRYGLEDEVFEALGLVVETKTESSTQTATRSVAEQESPETVQSVVSE